MGEIERGWSGGDRFWNTGEGEGVRERERWEETRS